MEEDNVQPFETGDTGTIKAGGATGNIYIGETNFSNLNFFIQTGNGSSHIGSIGAKGVFINDCDTEWNIKLANSDEIKYTIAPYKAAVAPINVTVWKSDEPFDYNAYYLDKAGKVVFKYEQNVTGRFRPEEYPTLYMGIFKRHV